MKILNLKRKKSEIMDNRINDLFLEQSNLINACQTNTMTAFTTLFNNIEIIKRNSNELVFSEIFHDTIKHSKWLNIPLSLSSGAIGYPFAYILYRTLDEIKPTSILETGLGQSTKIITEYVKHFEGIRHDVVEHDENWINFFKMNTNMSEVQSIHLLKAIKRKFKGCYVNAYEGFKEEFFNKKYSLISIDGPIGTNDKYSRIDVIDILPQCLEKQFVILIDDCERLGEKNTIKLIESKLQKNGISFSSGYQYWGRTSVYICTSSDLDFLCHI